MAECKDCIHKKVCFKQTIRKDLTPKGFELNCDNFISKECAELVRCKDCIHWGGVAFGFVCRKLSGIETKICMGADHFCSYGERKEE